MPRGASPLSVIPDGARILVRGYLDSVTQQSMRQTSKLTSNNPVTAIWSMDFQVLDRLSSIVAKDDQHRDASLNKLTTWMSSVGYSDQNPLIVDLHRFRRYENALRYYFLHPDQLNFYIKLMPAQLYPLLSQHNLVIDFQHLARIVLPVLPSRPPSIVSDLMVRGVEWHLQLLVHYDIWAYMVFTDRATAALIKAGHDILRNPNEAQWRKDEARMVLQWLYSIEYMELKREYVKE